MSMLDAFFNKGFKGAKCKTLLKLTIPRIKLLRNKKEVQLKQMRRDIAKLLETGQEATARIRVEHIIREENIMAAHEIIELFCELIAVRLPIIETQRECPLDLKEAISSICFAAPRCSDLPELLQVQMLFSSKYGKEFVAAATELMPDCGVNRKIIELLSVRAPSAEVKLNLLKEIAEEYELDWDPNATETEFFKPREDLLNGPSHFISGSKLPLPKEKHEESLSSTAIHDLQEQSDSEFDSLDLPEVPRVSIRPSVDTGSEPVLDTSFPTKNDAESAPEMVPPITASPGRSARENRVEVISHGPNTVPDIPSGITEDKQFIPFISSPSFSGLSAKQSVLPPSLSRTKSDGHVDFQDVLAAAQAAAESAERAAAAARSAASLAQVRISELITRRIDQVETPGQPAVPEIPEVDHRQSSVHDETDYEIPKRELSGFDETDYGDQSSHQLKRELSGLSEPDYGDELSHQPRRELSGLSEPDFGDESSHRPQRELSGLSEPDYGDQASKHPQRLTSLEEDSYFSYPNLFDSQDSNLRSGISSSADNSLSTHDHKL